MNDSVDRLASALEDRYRIESELGSGGMATVYLAEDLKHHRKVAVKVLRPELAAVLGAERFLKEIEVTAKLQHAHILPLFDSGEADSFLYYVMPHVEGESLRDRLNRDKQLPVEEAVRIAEMVASALDSAHRHDIIHRDIKPENILLHEGQALVADFGIALAVSAAAGGRMTETGLSLGTPHYMSPEQATADRKITGASDVYSLGCVTYEMLTGDPPYLGNTAQAIIAKIISDVPRPVRELRATAPGHVELALHKALEKLPADRFATAKEFADALTNPAFTLPSSAAFVAPVKSGPGRHRFVWPAIAVVAFVLAVWGWVRQQASNEPVTRFYITLQGDEALRGFALAPDASVLAYLGSGAGGGELWIKPRHEVRAIRLGGTEGAQAPFFSPDGTWIGFFADGKLKKVPISGGAPITLAESIPPLYPSGAWLDDGSVVYTGPQWELLRVSENGGVSEEVLRIESRVLFFISALPGARGIVFTDCPVTRGCREERVVRVMDFRNGDTRILLEDVRQAWYLASRHLLYVRPDGAGLAVPFNLKTLTVEGAAVPVIDAVSRRELAPLLSVSETGTPLYMGAEQLQSRVNEPREIVWVNREGVATQVDPAWTGEFESVALSPDGTKLAATFATTNGTEVWIKQMDRGPESRLTFTDGLNHRPAWTRDGLSVTFISNRGGTRDLYVKRADGVGTAEVALDLAVTVGEGFWSPDGDWLIYRAGITEEERDILAWRPGPDSTTVPVATAPGVDEVAPALSPDGRWLAYVSNETGRQEVWVRRFPDVEAGRWQVSVRGGTEPVWAHSGRELFYKSQGALMVVGVQTNPTFATLEVQELFSTQRYLNFDLHAQYDVTADGQRFVMIRNRSTGEGELILVENFFEELKDKVEN